MPALDGGIDKFYTRAFLSWSDLICPLPTQVTYLSFPVLDGVEMHQGCLAPLTDVQVFTIKTLLASDATCGAIRVTFQNASQAKLLGETFLSPKCLCMTLIRLI